MKAKKDKTVDALLGQIGRGDQGVVPSTQTHSFETKCENQFLIARPVNASRRKDNKGFTLAIEITNKLKDAIYLAYTRSNGGGYVRLIGNAGTAILGRNVGITDVYEYSIDKSALSDKTEISGGAKSTVLFDFATKEPVKDELINFSINNTQRHFTLSF